MVIWVCLKCMIVAFPGHTHLLLYIEAEHYITYCTKSTRSKQRECFLVALSYVQYDTFIHVLACIS